LEPIAPEVSLDFISTVTDGVLANACRRTEVGISSIIASLHRSAHKYNPQNPDYLQV
jgi:hypothetical protein